jgi:UDP-glucose 4-epimerase
MSFVLVCGGASHIDAPDGTFICDYAYVDYLRDTHVRALDYLGDHSGHSVENPASWPG